MSNNHVSQPTALLLKDAGWDTTTDFSYNEGPLVYETWAKTFPRWWLPAPSIVELRKRLRGKDLQNYFDSTIWLKEPFELAEFYWERFAWWSCDVTASADDLARIWLWAQGQEEDRK